MKNKIELQIVALSHSVTQTRSYAVVLEEVNGNRRLPIVIGGAEAQSIAVALEKISPKRPLTHDLMKNLCEEFGINLTEVIIYKLEEGIFHSLLILEHEGNIHEIDSRTSDAIALALRFGCPIYTYQEILDAAGINIDEPPTVSEAGESEGGKRPVDPSRQDLSEYSLKELNKLLKDSLENEDYEQAARIRDEINRRKESS